MSVQGKFPVYLPENGIKKAAQSLWNSLAAVYRQCAVSYTGFRDSYAKSFPVRASSAFSKKQR